MNRRLAETLIRYLSFSEDIGENRDSLSSFRSRQWEDTFRWLDNANLALYLLQKLRDNHDEGKLPPAALARLEQNYSKNRLRLDEMAGAFAEVNEAFRQFGVNYAVVKGFSLAPSFCPDASLRQQSDLDYLVDEQSLPMAQQALGDLGFFLKKHSAAAGEWTFAKTPISPPVNSSQQYEGGRYVVELLLGIWRQEDHEIEIAGAQFSPSRSVDHEWRGLHFRALPEEDAFLLQVLHVFQHLLSGPVRMAWFYEIAYCLHRRQNDTLFWQLVEQRTAADPLLPDLMAIITGLAAKFFHASLPGLIQEWKANLQPPISVWLENYGWRVPFEKIPAYELALFPTSKLILFLHQQFLPNLKHRRDLTRRHLIPWTGFIRTGRSIIASPSAPAPLQKRHEPPVFHRILYHTGSGLRYLCEIPRWWWLNRSQTVRETLETSTRSTKKRWGFS
jgi:hypothetical protein